MFHFKDYYKSFLRSCPMNGWTKLKLELLISESRWSRTRDWTKTWGPCTGLCWTSHGLRCFSWGKDAFSCDTAWKSLHPSVWSQFMLSLKFISFLFICLSHVACGFLGPGIEPRPSAVKVLSLNHWTLREFPLMSFLMWCDLLSP